MAKATCEECDKEAVCRGYCHGHYWKLRRYGDPLGSSPGRKAPRFEPTDDLENSKVCSKCELRLPREAFHKLSKSKDGLQPRCRNCYRDWWNERYRDNPEFRDKRSEHFAKFYEEKYPSNMALGLFRENPDVLAAAIRYLEETKPGQLPLFAA